MVKVLVVLADVLLNLEAGRKVRYALHRPRFDVRAGIIDGRFDFQMAQIGTTVPFNQVQPGRHRLTTRAQPSLVIETDCVDDQRVSVPMADRMRESTTLVRRKNRPLSSRRIAPSTLCVVRVFATSVRGKELVPVQGRVGVVASSEEFAARVSPIRSAT